MGQINGYSYTSRGERPTTTQRVGLRASFFNQGAGASPVAISGVTLFSKSDFADASSVLGTDGLISSSITAAQIKYHWSNDYSDPIDGADEGNTTSGSRATLGYNEQANDGSSVWWLGDEATTNSTNATYGNFAVILEGQKGSDDPNWPTAPAATYSFHGSSVTIPMSTRATGDYFEVWTVQLADDLPYTSFIFPVTLHHDTWVGLPEPIRLTTSHRLLTKKIANNSTVDIKIATELTVLNKNLDSSMRNVLNGAVFTNLGFQLQKINEHPGDRLAPICMVIPEGKNVESGVYDTDWATTTNSYPNTKKLSPIYYSSDNTINIPMDFRKTGGGSLTSGNKSQMGHTCKGTWRVRCRYDLIGETLISPWMYFIVY